MVIQSHISILWTTIRISSIRIIFYCLLGSYTPKLSFIRSHNPEHRTNIKKHSHFFQFNFSTWKAKTAQGGFGPFACGTEVLCANSSVFEQNKLKTIPEPFQSNPMCPSVPCTPTEHRSRKKHKRSSGKKN